MSTVRREMEFRPVPLCSEMMPNAGESKIPFTPPMEYMPVRKIPEGEAWVYELKLDWYRAQAIRDRAGVRLLSRRGKRSHQEISARLARTAGGDQSWYRSRRRVRGLRRWRSIEFQCPPEFTLGTHVIFFAFDILVSEDKDVKALPLRQRKDILKSTLHASDHVQLADHFGGPLSRFLEGVKQIGGEGVVAKRLDSRV